MSYNLQKIIPLDSYSKEVFNDITFVKYSSYIFDQINT
jgi:hypothetical protein